MSKNKRVPREHIAFRVDQTLVDEIDAGAKEICLPGSKPTRAAALRALIHLGLSEIDEVGLDAFLARLDVKAPRGRGRGAMIFDEKKSPQANRSVIDDEEREEE
jgi:hypothetical protein